MGNDSLRDCQQKGTSESAIPHPCARVNVFCSCKRVLTSIQCPDWEITSIIAHYRGTNFAYNDIYGVWA